MLLRIAHVDDAHDPRFVVIRDPGSYEIGGAGGSSVVLADSTVSQRHARLTLQDGKIFVEDLGSDTGTFVDEEPIAGVTEVELGQWIRVGETVLQVMRGDRPPVAVAEEGRAYSPIEQPFLAALRANPADDETRIVYADWLEAEGFRIAAQFLRLELADEVDINTSPLVERACSITELAWRALVCRGPIGACDRASCPARWHLLVPREVGARDCSTCNRTVFYCASREDVAKRGEQRALVVFDAQLTRQMTARVYFRGLRYDPDGSGEYDFRRDDSLFGPIDVDTEDRALDELD
jgi:uncharacterized protein (TIGR02996 family)